MKRLNQLTSDQPHSHVTYDFLDNFHIDLGHQL